MRSLVLCLLFAAGSSAFAGEFAILASGARLYVDRHEADAAKVRLYHGTDFVELSASGVKGFEVEEAIAAPPPAPTQTPTPAAQPPVPAAPAVIAVADPRDLADRAADKYGLP